KRTLRMRGRRDAPRRAQPAAPRLDRLLRARPEDRTEHSLLMDRLGLASDDPAVADELGRRLDRAYRQELAEKLIQHREDAWAYAAMRKRLPPRSAIARDAKARAAHDRYRRFLDAGVRFSREAIAVVEREQAGMTGRLVETADWERVEATLGGLAAEQDFRPVMHDTYRSAVERWAPLREAWNEVRDESWRRFPRRGDLDDRRARLAAIESAVRSRAETRRFLDTLVKDHRRPRVAAAAFRASVAGRMATTGTYRAMERLLARPAGAAVRELGLTPPELPALRGLVSRRGPKRRAISTLIGRRAPPSARRAVAPRGARR
ncbi:MAG TPA: hypothetical protein VMZ28_06190, partial [Kofleriaceae bacterium]|nr:hypothetical protein [Kofleriaceae bacterium]